MGVSELAKTLGLSKGSVFRLLVTLTRRGYVEKDADSDRYQLTYRLFAVGSRAASRLGLLGKWPSRSWSVWGPGQGRP